MIQVNGNFSPPTMVVTATVTTGSPIRCVDLHRPTTRKQCTGISIIMDGCKQQHCIALT